MAAPTFPKIDPLGIPAMSLTDGRPQRVLLFRNRDRMNRLGIKKYPQMSTPFFPHQWLINSM